MIYQFLADGFEEIEAIAPLDMLRRVGVEVTTVGVSGKTIIGAHGIIVTADITTDEVDLDAMQGIILPGGMPGTANLAVDATIQKALDICTQHKLLIAAICAAPSILGQKGLLRGKKATCFPGFETKCEEAFMLQEGVVTDGNIITARGAGCAISFGAALVTYTVGTAASEKLLRDLQWYYERHTRI